MHFWSAPERSITQPIRELVYKEPVRAASTGPDLLGNIIAGYVMDTVTLVAGDRVLLKDQALGKENGIRVIRAVLAPVRSSDANTDSEVVSGMVVPVTEGFVNVDKLFMLTTNNPIILGTTPLTFSVYSGGGGGGGTRLSKGDVDIAALVTVNDGDQAIAAGLAATPALGGNLLVFVDGAEFVVGDGVKTKDCYFSGDGGVTARAIANIIAGDTLHWVGSVAGFQLQISDRVSIIYAL